LGWHGAHRLGSSVVVVAAPDVLVGHGDRGGHGVGGGAIEAALEDRVDVAVGAGASGQRPGTRRLQPRRVVALGEPQDAEAGAVPLLGNCSPYPVCRIGRSSARLAAGCWEVERRRAAEDRYPAARSWGSVTVPGLAIARRVASARYAAGSTPASFADSISV